MKSKLFILIGVSLFTVSSGLLSAAAKAVPSRSPNKSVHKLNEENRAIAIVEKLKDVQDWEKAFGPKHFNPATNGRPAFSVDEHHGSVFSVQAFEDTPDHTVTFARYQVNLKTGRVKKEAD